MTYDETLLKIKSLSRFGSKPGTSRIKVLLNAAGNPQAQSNFVHVAGTNGKGSVSSLIASILKESGYTVGLYTSPEITDFRERIMLNGKMIKKNNIIKLFKFFEPLLEDPKFAKDAVTEFELTTAMALKFFADEKCDVVVLETGLGGRLDATNIIKNPLCSVITSISLDHTKILGETVEKIAQEKCGIIKPGCPVVLGQMSNEVYAIAKYTAKKNHSDVILADSLDFKDITYFLRRGTSLKYKNQQLKIMLLGRHQVLNLATALAAIEILEKKFNISQKAIKDGVHNAHIPCRLEILGRSNIFILDGAHNPAGAQTLTQFIKDYLKGKNITGIVGMYKDKDYKKVLSQVCPLLDKTFTVGTHGTRGLLATDISTAAKLYCNNVIPFKSIPDAISYATKINKKNSVNLVFGSFSIMKDVKESIKNL